MNLQKLRHLLSTGSTVRLLFTAFAVILLVDIVLFRTALGNCYPPLAPWLDPQPILSVATLLIGLIVLSWQLDRQYKNTLASNQRNARDKLNLDIYNEIARRIEATSTPLTELGGTPTAFVGELIVRQHAAKDAPPSRYRFADFLVISRRASDSVIALMSILETYEIVMSEFAVFRRRLAESFRQVSAPFGDFSNLAVALFDTPLRWPPSADEQRELSRLAKITQGAAIAIQGDIWDLRVAAQNYLLGGLFPGRRVPERTPSDPSVQVTRLPPAEG